MLVLRYFLLTLKMVCLFSVSGVVSFTSRDNKNVTIGDESNHVGALLRFCLDHQPDGATLLTSSSDQEIIALFKLDKFWLQPTEELLEFIVDRNTSQYREIFSNENALNIIDWLPKYPSEPDHIVSFTGMEKEQPFYNNILVFKERTVVRYRVKHLQFSADVTQLRTQLVGTYSTALWFNLPNSNMIQTVTILRGTRALIMLYSDMHGLFSRTSLYILNEDNLENPIHYLADSHQLPGISAGDKSTIKFYYQLITGQKLYFKSSGRLCLEEQCREIQSAVGCEPNVRAFLDSFAYWLWKETKLTLRLLIIALAAVGVVNLIIALSFIHTHLKKMVDLL